MKPKRKEMAPARTKVIDMSLCVVADDDGADVAA